MSVINNMLLDLDKRQGRISGSPADSGDLVRAAPPPAPRRWPLHLALVAAVAGLSFGVATQIGRAHV